jgi:hypothetical protein
MTWKIMTYLYYGEGLFMQAIISAMRAAVKLYPAVIPHLSNKMRYIIAAQYADEMKDADGMESRVRNLAKALYNDVIDIGSFIDSMAALIARQITLAYNAAWVDDGNELPLPDYLQDASEILILEQFMFVDGFAQDIINARLTGQDVDGLLSRAELWANRYNEAYNEAITKIAVETGGKLVWMLGKTEEHCETCAALNGKVDYAVEWDRAGLHPQGAPNDMLECGGWRCDCSLVPTDMRRTRGGLAGMGY